MFKRPGDRPSDPSNDPIQDDDIAEVSISSVTPKTLLRVSPVARKPANETDSTDDGRAEVRRKSAGGAGEGRKGNPRNSVSVVDEWLTTRGDLETEGNLHVKGRVFGNIRCLSVICEIGARIEGEIDAEDVVIRGETSGTIRARNVRLESSARVDSDIFHESFACEPGARIEGRLSYHPEETKAATQRPTTTLRPANGSSNGHHAAPTPAEDPN